MGSITQEELNEVIRKHGLWLEDNPKGKKADLSYKDLSGLDFSNTNLKYADLHDANLKWADLHGADLRRTNLKGANLRNAELGDANLENANLRHANFYEANLKGAVLGGTVLKGADLRGADLKGADIDYSTLPLWCGGFGFKADKRIASQIAYHFCMINCDDVEFIEARNFLLKFANKFHRVETGECNKLGEIPLPVNK